MYRDELQKLMQSTDETEVNFHPHYVKTLRQLADDIESGKQTGIKGTFLMAHDEPGIVKYSIVTKYNP
ncbi:MULTISPECIES: hypothetical protein [Enterobacter]|jgi:hypothetical protein|uniref:hypothetical protein n=1 Tax=Enterobacter TaxID=547 RepID=UPI000EF97A2C|nr:MULTISPECIES: hypothetical protein [Enterobacter]RMA89440.1 hypothetical protein BJ885_1400 [Enterobacter sp. WP_7_1]RMA99408.1 hypothetical protein BJ886_1496 [Enterobacter sp. WP_7_2]WNI51480.1 hypothetical protein RIK63_09210 [Enterobacter asburiae]